MWEGLLAIARRIWAALFGGGGARTDSPASTNVGTGQSSAASGQGVAVSGSGNVVTYGATPAPPVHIGEWQDWPDAPVFRFDPGGSTGRPDTATMERPMVTQMDGGSVGALYASARGPGVAMERQRMERVGDGRQWRSTAVTARWPQLDDPQSVEFVIDFTWEGATRRAIWDFVVGRRGAQDELVDIKTVQYPTRFE